MKNEAIKRLKLNKDILFRIYHLKQMPMPEDLEKLSENNSQALALLRDEPDGWIPVSERLPERTGEYLVYPTAKHCPTLWYQKGWYWYSHQDDSIQETVGYCEDPILEVTHWKPIVLPKPACQTCGGSGRIFGMGENFEGDSIPCPDCPPKGPKPDEEIICPTCDRLKFREQTIEDIPPDVELSSLLRTYAGENDLVPRPLLDKAAARIEALETILNIEDWSRRGFYEIGMKLSEQAQQIAELKAKKEAE